MKVIEKKNNVLLDYTFVLDASGSMFHDIDEVLCEVNQQLQDLKDKQEELGRPCRATIVKFDSVYTVLRDNERIEKLKPLTKEEYKAGGMTALYDAFGLSVKRADARVNFKVRRGDAEALVVVFTDGGENVSKEFDGPAIAKLFEEYQDREGWEIVLIGTDVSTMVDMEQRKMRRSKMRSYGQHEKKRALQNLSLSVSDYYSGVDQNFSLSKEAFIEKQRLERERANETREERLERARRERRERYEAEREERMARRRQLTEEKRRERAQNQPESRPYPIQGEDEKNDNIID